ncbi:MAG: M1 family aminopeptidase, partial [Vicinamibacterales bacterium]
AYRAIIYNKGAVVLHMLRQLVGDDAFFKGLRRFYSESRFTKVGTDDLRQAMEKEGGQPLDRFFERWVYGSTLPTVKVTYRVEATPAGQEAVLRFEQGAEVFDLPMVVTLTFADRRKTTVIVPLTQTTLDHRVPIQGTLVKAEINRDAGGLAQISTGRWGG